MALISCKECGGQVSSTAAACPACGAPLKAVKAPAKTSGCAWLALVFLAIPFLGGMLGLFGTRSEEAAAPRLSDAQCQADLQCWGDRQAGAAEGPCRRAVEALAQYQAEWTDGLLEPKFPRFAWADQARGDLRYLGNSVKFQNGFGAWQMVSYACDFSPSTRSASARILEP